MIAVTVSLLFALYVVGPDAVSRLVLGFTLPRRSLQVSRGEEISRSLVWSFVSAGVGFLWARADGSWSRVWDPALLKAWFAGIYSESFFNLNRELWFRGVGALFRLNRCLLPRTYLVVLVLAITLAVLTNYYGVLRDRLPQWGWLQTAFAALLLQRVAQWHLLLSKLLLGDHTLAINVDILTKADKLYQGVFTGKALAADGSLISVTLEHPRRFDRPAYLRPKSVTRRRNRRRSGKRSLRTLFW